MADKDEKTEGWTTRHMSIFVKHNDKLYCLHWDYMAGCFDIRDTATASPGPNSVIFRTRTMPDSVTPTNALDKLRIYLVFS
jgi:hypothetical protein